MTGTDSAPEKKTVALFQGNAVSRERNQITIQANQQQANQRHIWIVETRIDQQISKLADLLVDPGLDYPNMPLVCLLLVRLNGDLVPFPGDGIALEEGDRLLLWGAVGARHRLHFLVKREDLFEAVLSARCAIND